MPRLTGMILWWWRQWTSSPMSKGTSLPHHAGGAGCAHPYSGAI